MLHDITLMPSGAEVAFVGATGAGKTTITNLINRFYDWRTARSGTTASTSTKSKGGPAPLAWHRFAGYNLFTGTIRDNIRYGNLRRPTRRSSPRRIAGADDFIRRLPDGYDTVITGTEAACRRGPAPAFVHCPGGGGDPPVMILDEATSSIDTRTGVHRAGGVWTA